MTKAYVAIDLGAESGRVIVGSLAAGTRSGGPQMRLEEIHRFTHEPVWLPTGLHWNITGIWREIVVGLRQAAAWASQNKVQLVSVGVDTWGVDWALVDAAGELVGLPHAYRDPRNASAYAQVLEKLGAERIYATTGIQFMSLNTLYSLYAHKLADPGALEAADRLLFMPDLFHFWLSGKAVVEATIASTSQMVDCHTGHWATAMLADLDLPTGILGPIVPPGHTIGPIRVPLAAETGLPEHLLVVAPAAHDTASGVAAVPAVGDFGLGIADFGLGIAGIQSPNRNPQSEIPNWCYLSSGTWSLLGAELTAPCVTPEAQAAMFTNELGVGGTTRFLKNIPGLWLVQECRRDLARKGQELDYEELTRLAEAAEPLRTLVDPAYASFETPGDMLTKIADFARATSQPLPDSPGQFVRGCLESLALTYRDKLAAMESILGRKFDVIHVVGGGGKNWLLCQMTADATGRRVVVGPYEATALGNALVQAMAAGDVKNLTELRQIVARSFELVTYEPQDTGRWQSVNQPIKANG